MKKFSISFIICIFTLVILAVNVIFEQSTNKNKPPSTNATNERVALFKNKQLHIAVFQGGYGPEYWKKITKMFEEQYPGVKVNLTISPRIGDVIRANIVSGNPPDFLAIPDTDQSGIINSLIREKGLMDITGVFNEQALDRNVLLKDMILPGLLDFSRFSPYKDGKIYLAPFNAAPMGLIYNKQLFIEKGWELPQTWDDFFKLSIELEKPENYVQDSNGTLIKRALFTYQGIYPEYLEEILYPAIANAAGIEQLKKIFRYEQNSFNTPEVQQVLDIIAKLGSEEYILEGSFSMNHTQAQQEMMLGKAVFVVNGAWMENEMKDSPREAGFEFGMIPVPTLLPSDEKYILSSYEQFSIPVKAKNPELAKEFLKFLYTDKSVQLFAENSNGIFALKQANELSKNYLTSGVYEMFGAFEGATAITQEWTIMPQDFKYDIDDYLFKHMVTPVMNGEKTTTDWMNYVEEVFTEIQISIDNLQLY